MSNRAQAALRNLQLRLLESLPYLQELHAPPELLGIILQDYHAFQKVETTQKLLYTQVAKDIKQGYATGESEATTELRKKVKQARQESKNAEQAVERAIDKHYRSKSRQLHPDRHGQQYEQEFDLLGKARELLKIPEKRRLYLEQMMQVAQISPSLVEKSHYAWIQRHVAQQAQATTSTRKQTLLIKGGIGSDVPRKAYVSTLNLKKRRIAIELPVKQSFLRYCMEIQVEATCSDFDGIFKISTIPEKDFEQVYNKSTHELSVETTLPISGIWHVLWFALLEINGNQVTSPHSHASHVDLTSEEQRRRRSAIISTNELAKQRAGDIQFILRKLRGPRPDHLEIERRCDLLHEVVARGRSTLNRLLDLLRADGLAEETQEGNQPLRQALDLAKPAKQELQAQLELILKKDSLKSLKHHVAGLLESGEAASWLRTVEQEELQALGGGPNRLFQILVEGSVAHHLELDGATLEAAAGRHDLFTPKQCEFLRKKSMESLKRVEQEAERALAQAKEERQQEIKEAAELQLLQKRQAEEAKKQELLKARYEAERQAHLDAIRESEAMARGEHPAHSLVEIHGLKTKQGQSLNGTIGTVMHKKGERYVVQCQIDGKLRSFMPSSLNNLGVSSSDFQNTNGSSWSCDICTYLHEGDRASATVCDICNNPRENKAPPNMQSSVIASDNDAPAAKKQTAKQQQPVAAKPASKAKSPDRKPSKKDTSTQPCFHGSNCRYIKSGRECKFYHTPEEIEAAAMGKNKADYEIFIPDVAVGWVIGTGGAHMKEVQRKSHAKVSIDQKKWYPNKTRIVRMHGTQQQIDTAVKMIKELVAEYDDGHGSTFKVTTRTPDSKTNSPPPQAKSPTPNGPVTPVARASTSPPSPPAQAIHPPHQVAQPTTISPPKSTYIAPPPPVPPVQTQQQIRKPVETPQVKERPVTPSPRASPRLQLFLQEQKGCLKGSPEAFYDWLATEDIVSLDDLATAVSDEDYLHEVLQQGDGKVGVKGFKRAAFKKAALAAIEQSMNGLGMNGGWNEDEAPSELVCPISHLLMSNDPVIAADGHTYEGAAIDAWFRKQQMEISAANQQITRGNDSQQARAIVDRGVLSPMTHSKMAHLNLTPNLNVRNLARDYANGS